MNAIEKKEFKTMQQDIQEIKEKVDKLFTALLGSELTDDGGLVGRIDELEKHDATLFKKMEALENKTQKSDFYVKMLWTCAGVIGSGFVYIIIQLILSWTKK